MSTTKTRSMAVIRIILSMLMLCTLVSLTPIIANATSSTPITTVNVTGLTEPKWGNTPDFTVTVTQTNQKLVAIEWYDKDSGDRLLETENTKFLAGHTYQLKLFLQPIGANRYSETASECYLTHTGGSVKKAMVKDGGYHDPDGIGRVATFEFMMGGTSITSVDIIGLVVPDGFATPDMNISFDDTPVSQGLLKWYDITTGDSGTQLSGSSRFQYGHKYRLFLGIKPNEGYYFRHNDDDLMEGSYYYPNGITINDKGLSYYSLRLNPYIYDYSDDTLGGMLILQIEFTVGNQIKNVDLTVPQPATGATPATASAVTGKQSTYTVTNISWSPADAKFLPSKSYTATVTLKANAEYTFPQTTAFTVNTLTPVKLVSGIGTDEIQISYTFPSTVALKPPVITKQPANVNNAQLGDTVTFSVTATGDNLKYEWRCGAGISSTESCADTPSLYSGFNTPTLTVKVTDKCFEEGFGFWCFIQNDVGYEQSNSAKISPKYQLWNLTGIDILQMPTKTTYKKGETFEPNGLVLKLILTEGYLSGTVYSDMKFSPTVLNTVGTQKITVTYQEKTTTFNVTVTEGGDTINVTGIEMFNLPHKTTYKVGETFDPEGLIIKILLAEGGWLQGNNFKDMTFSPMTLNTAGTQKITVTYQGKTTSFDVTVTDTAHVHDFTGSYKFDNTQHWQECACGEKSNIAGHTFGEWETVKAASATEEGSKKRVCSVCGYEETEVIPALGNETSAADTTAPITTTTITTTPDASDTVSPDTSKSAPTDPEKPAGTIPWWIFVVAAVVVVGLITVVVIFIKKEKQ